MERMKEEGGRVKKGGSCKGGERADGVVLDMDKSDLQESLATLYLRLNGYFTSGFIAHAPEGNLTEIDILAVRFPYNLEHEREIEPSAWLQIQQGKTDVLICEVKGEDEKLQFNPSLRNNPEAVQKIIHWIGLFQEDDVEMIAKELLNLIATHEVQTPTYFPGYVLQEKNLSIRGILFAPDRPTPRRNQLRYVPGNEIIGFIWRCLCPDTERTYCDIRYDFGLWGGYQPIVIYFKERHQSGQGQGTMQDIYAYFGCT